MCVLRGNYLTQDHDSLFQAFGTQTWKYLFVFIGFWTGKTFKKPRWPLPAMHAKAEKVNLQRGKEWSRSLEMEITNHAKHTETDQNTDRETEMLHLVLWGFPEPWLSPSWGQVAFPNLEFQKLLCMLAINFPLWYKLAWMDYVYCNVKTSIKPEMTSLSC